MGVQFECDRTGFDGNFFEDISEEVGKKGTFNREQGADIDRGFFSRDLLIGDFDAAALFAYACDEHVFGVVSEK